jgi:SAM-dependent methyltransferase
VNTGDAWAALADQYVESLSGSVKGRVRVHVLHQHLRAHLPDPPVAVVDVGGGAGHQSLPLARLGYEVTIVDPSPAMLAKAAEALDREEPAVRRRVRLVEAGGEQAPAVLAGTRFAAVLCHGVLMYVEQPEPLLAALCELATPGGVVSIVAQNAWTCAVRPALEGRWADALAAFDVRREVGILGLATRADTLEELTTLLAEHGVERQAWYGVWLFTDGWARDTSPTPLDDVLAVELEASRRDPYRQLSRLFHLVGRKTPFDLHS